MRVVCALGGLGSIHVTPAEAERCACVVEAAAPMGRVGELGLCFLLSSPGIGRTLGQGRLLAVWEALLRGGAPEVCPPPPPN